MKFRDLYLLNLDWSDDDTMVTVFDGQCLRPERMTVKNCHSLFRDRVVLWFDRCSVCLLQE